MKTIKIIELLNKIANGEDVPKKIRINGRNDSIYEWQPINNTNLYHYFNIDTHARMGSDWRLDGRLLNNEVEIIEEDKKIEQIDLGDWTEIVSKSDIEYEMFKYIFNKNAKIFAKKISELIDEVNELTKVKNDEINKL